MTTDTPIGPTGPIPVISSLPKIPEMRITFPQEPLSEQEVERIAEKIWEKIRGRIPYAAPYLPYQPYYPWRPQIWSLVTSDSTNTQSYNEGAK